MRDSSVEAEQIDYAKTGLSEATVLDIIKKAGGVAAVINARHATAKDKGWVTTPPSPEVFAKAVVGEVNLLRRPIIVDGDRVIIGFDRDAYAKLGGGKKSTAKSSAHSKPATKAPAKKPAAKKPAKKK